MPPASVTSSNGQMTVFSPPDEASPGASLVAVPEQSDISFPTPEKGAEDMAFEYDELNEADELANLQYHQQASNALAELNNRGQSSHQGTLPPMNLDQLADRAMSTRLASAQLSKPHKLEQLEGQENQARI